MNDDTDDWGDWYRSDKTKHMRRILEKRREEAQSALIQAAATSTDPKVTAAHALLVSMDVILKVLEEPSKPRRHD